MDRIPTPPSPHNLAPEFLFNESPKSPSVQETISQIEKQTSSTSGSDLASMSRHDKRKPEASPETVQKGEEDAQGGGKEAGQDEEEA